MLTVLDDHPDATEPEPFAGPDHPIRQLTVAVAAGKEWRRDHSERMAALFDEMAPEWSARHVDESKRAPVMDAFERGGAPTAASWLELGSGTGAGAVAISPLVDSLICTDVSAGMLSFAPELAPRSRADASRLPFVDDSFDAVMMINMLLFPAEVDRVLRTDGTVLWVNTLGDQTPIHLPAEVVLDSLPGDWSGTTARAGTGFWLTARRR